MTAIASLVLYVRLLTLDPREAVTLAARHVRQLRSMVPADRVADAWRLGVGRVRRGA